MIVMKFGGTSVQDAKAIERAGAIVKGRLEQKPVVVVSAMAKVTDQLLAMARAAGCRRPQDRAQTLPRPAGAPLQHCRRTVGHGALHPVSLRPGRDFETLEELLRGIAAVGELTPRTTDYVSAFGEILSSKIVAAAFSALGMPSALVDSREWLVTDSAHMRAAPLFEETNQRLQSRVAPLVAAGKVPVMGGFIGSSKAGITTTIGRGGSDYSAAIAGAGLGAERIEIWTDVDGMMTTDPRLCADARRIKVISFDEAAELAYFGAKVLHPATVLARGAEKYSGLHSELRQSHLRRHAHYRPRPPLPQLFQGHRGEKAHHHRGCGRSPHAAGAWLSQFDFFRFRPASGGRGRSLHFGSKRLAHRGLERIHPPAGRGPGQTGGRKI